ncbi:lysophospholipid acyltransferase family protein [Lactobacillus xylocopicola]|uniref:1-acyl-sn-glycerol-3-phosphate acyltransferase n=1 Tax=Lactobacillus xylocopicola TaxID=2976676 RepID=A0ABM8BF37_9LACO|nr:1-acyl-sn-glycerol-3-phosphate acyltransferase [Lactobacillus xylocopicola]BDR59820.1 hypothetical protein KIM322_00810 [Lactobacillus xylocopicola]
MAERKFYYHHLTDDLVVSRQQDYQLPDNYSIFPTTSASKAWAKIIRLSGGLISLVYVRAIARIQIVGKEKLQLVSDQGYFIYGNHTQPFGDIVLPLSLVPWQNYYAIGAPANWGIPILGKLVLPYFALPVGQNLKQSGKLISAVTQVIQAKKTVVIYPEAHVWPYYTKIRPFTKTSMHFPVALHAPSFTMTTTYSRLHLGKRPRITVYIDGPFYPDRHLDKKQAQVQLHTQISAAMQRRAHLSNYQYYTYQRLV